MPETYWRLVEAQTRVFNLWETGADSSAQEMKVAMNRLMSFVRNADPETMAAFSAWRQQEEQRRVRRAGL